jgi:hypothetical protein
MKPAALIATLILTLVALAHLLRIILRVEVTVGGTPIPMWLSGVAVVFAGGVAIMLWSEGRR